MLQNRLQKRTLNPYLEKIHKKIIPESLHGGADSITGQLNKAYQDTVNKNRDALSSIVRTIILCGRQNLALRGHQEDHGNFISLLKYRAETDQALAIRLANAPNNATYISPLIQNELINLCRKQMSAIISIE